MRHAAAVSGLVYGALRGDLASVRQGLADGADVDEAEPGGKRAINEASWHGHVAVVAALLDAGASPRSASDEGLTSLHFAAAAPDGAVAELLMKRANLDVNVRDALRRTPLHCVLTPAAAITLIKAGAQVDARDAAGRTPLMAHVGGKGPFVEPADVEVVRALLKAGADAKARDDRGKSSLHYATSRPVAEALLAAGAELEGVDAGGRTPVFYVGQTFDMGALDLLVSRGARVNVRDRTGMTPLHVVVAEGLLDPSEYFKAHGADLSATDQQGRKPLDVAKALGGNQGRAVRDAMVELLSGGPAWRR